MKPQVLGRVAFLAASITAVLFSPGCKVQTFNHSTADLSPLIDDLFLAIEQDAVAKKYDELASADFRRAIPLEQFVKTGRDVNDRLGALKGKKLMDARFRNENGREVADVAYAGTFNRGEGLIRASFVSQDGRWLLYAFMVSSPAFKPEPSSE